MVYVISNFLFFFPPRMGWTKILNDYTTTFCACLFIVTGISCIIHGINIFVEGNVPGLTEAVFGMLFLIFGLHTLYDLSVGEVYALSSQTNETRENPPVELTIITQRVNDGAGPSELRADHRDPEHAIAWSRLCALRLTI